MKVIAVDFDGVIHSFASGWQNTTEIPDEPVDGSIKWLKNLIRHCQVVIFSCRAEKRKGRRAIKKWLLKHGLPKIYLKKLIITDRKPPADLMIDDRAICFTGEFPSISKILDFNPWHRQEIW